MKVKIFRPLRLTAVCLAIWLTALLCFPVSAASPRLAGDLNGDGRIAAEDMTVLRRALLGISDGNEEETRDINLDINLDDTVDIRDLVALATIIAGDGKTDGVLTVQSVTLSGTTVTLSVQNTSTVWETGADSYVALTCLDETGTVLGAARAKLGVVAPGATKTVQCTVTSGTAAVKAAGIAANYWSVL